MRTTPLAPALSHRPSGASAGSSSLPCEIVTGFGATTGDATRGGSRDVVCGGSIRGGSSLGAGGRTTGWDVVAAMTGAGGAGADGATTTVACGDLTEAAGQAGC